MQTCTVACTPQRHAGGVSMGSLVESVKCSWVDWNIKRERPKHKAAKQYYLFLKLTLEVLCTYVTRPHKASLEYWGNGSQPGGSHDISAGCQIIFWYVVWMEKVPCGGYKHQRLSYWGQWLKKVENHWTYTEDQQLHIYSLKEILAVFVHWNFIKL